MQSNSVQCPVPAGFQAISEVFEGCQIITDLDGDNDESQTEVFYLGSPANPAEGELGFTLTDSWDSREMLMTYCQTLAGRQEISKRASEQFPEWNEQEGWIED